MYSYLKTNNGGIPTVLSKLGMAENDPIEMQNRLASIGYIKFRDLPEELDTYIKNITDLKHFLITILVFNRYYMSQRYSYRYKRFVGCGRASNITGTNRSITDIFLLCCYYKPEYADIKLIYEAFNEIGSKIMSTYSMICSNIHRRVFQLRSDNKGSIIDQINGLLKVLRTALPSSNPSYWSPYTDDEFGIRIFDLKYYAKGGKERIDLPYRTFIPESLQPDDSFNVANTIEAKAQLAY